ncbi:ABC transporter permease, partial [bacterium LRH843]|nr:ABC transporter permease [bacterium LRH843]
VDPAIWQTIKTYSPAYTSGYFLNSVDMQKTPEGSALRDEDERIYGLLFQRTMFMSMVITISCILLGYPIAYLLSNLPSRTANLL